MSNLIRRKKPNSFSLFSGICLILLVFASCKTRQVTLKTKDAPPIKIAINTADSLIDKVRASQFNAGWAQGKATVDTDIDGKENSFNINLRMRKDSAIWISISPLLGIEVARVLITKDTIKFMDRLHGKFTVTDYNYINDWLHMNVDYITVQSILCGNFFNYLDKDKYNSVYLEDKYYILSTLSKHKLKRSLEDKDPNKRVIQDLSINGETFRIFHMEIEDQKIKKTLKADYDDFLQTDAGLFPMKSKTEVTAEKSFKISIEYSKLKVNEEQEFPFNIPASYSRIEDEH